MNRKELVEELIKLEADFDELCKKQKDVIEKWMLTLMTIKYL